MKYENPRQIRVSDIRIQDSFWSKVQNLIIDEVIPYQERILHDEVAVLLCVVCQSDNCHGMLPALPADTMMLAHGTFGLQQ